MLEISPHGTYTPWPIKLATDSASYEIRNAKYDVRRFSDGCLVYIGGWNITTFFFIFSVLLSSKAPNIEAWQIFNVKRKLLVEGNVWRSKILQKCIKGCDRSKTWSNRRDKNISIGVLSMRILRKGGSRGATFWSHSLRTNMIWLAMKNHPERFCSIKTLTAKSVQSIDKRSRL